MAPAGVVDVVRDHWSALLDGLRVTVELSVGGGALGFVVAVLLGLAAISRFTVLQAISRIIVEFFRGTSLIVQLFVLMYVTPQFGLWGSHPLVFCIIALGLNYGAYGSEVVRGSLNAVPKEQWESTTALSMPWLTKIRRVIWPQAWALMLPGLNNLMVMLVKGTAIAFYVSLPDLTFQADELRKRGVETMVVYSISFVLYYLVAMAFAMLLRRLEVRAQGRLGLSPGKVKADRVTAEAVA